MRKKRPFPRLRRAGKPLKVKPARVDLAEASPELERKWFELDRSIVVDELTDLRETINRGAMQLEMVSAEGMFDQPLSEAIGRKAGALRRLSRKLKNLAIKVASAAGYPKIRQRR